MLLPADRLLEILRGEIAGLDIPASAANDVSAAQSVAVTLALLLRRERVGARGVHLQMTRLADVVRDLRSTTMLIDGADERLGNVGKMLEEGQGLQDLHALEGHWHQCLFELEQALIAVRQSGLNCSLQDQIVETVSTWEINDLTQQFDSNDLKNNGTTHPIGELALRDYLRERFADDALELTSFQCLPGGFGKQTYLFDVESTKLSGSYVMRRDFPVPLIDNDCHRIDNEYEVIKAVRARGFPAPDAIWLDTTHPLLPGGDFIVMRRSPGIAGGTVISAKGEVPDDLAEILASILAHLHSLPPMEELSTLTDSINARRWSMPLRQCVREYLEAWPELLRTTPHLPSPALTGLLGWLLDHMPEMEGDPVLLHGDIGFHNFLFDDGKLTAVLDWEFAHLGDPAEELASVRNNVGPSLDWKKFIRKYLDEGGVEVNPERVHFFEVWGHVRNAISAIVSARTFLDRHQDDLKFVLTPHNYLPYFIRSAQALIQRGPID